MNNKMLVPQFPQLQSPADIIFFSYLYVTVLGNALGGNLENAQI
jgi:hypothetical protein